MLALATCTGRLAHKLNCKAEPQPRDFETQCHFRVMVNTLSQNLQNYWQHMGHLGYGDSRQEKTIEWIAVKLVKQQSKSPSHFSTTLSCYIIESILYNKTFFQLQSKCKQHFSFWGSNRPACNLIERVKKNHKKKSKKSVTKMAVMHE